jgi:hypothetical protein
MTKTHDFDPVRPVEGHVTLLQAWPRRGNPWKKLPTRPKSPGSPTLFDEKHFTISQAPPFPVHSTGHRFAPLIG